MKNLSIIMLFTLLVLNVKAQEANPRIVETAEGGIFLEWDSRSDCTYEIDYTADLTAGFTKSAASRIGTGSTMRVSIAEVSGFPLPKKAFVRLNVTEGLDGAFLLNVDSDGDGLPNSYELANGLDFNDPNDATLDLDGDGLNALEEFELGTSPYINNNDQTVVMGSEQLVPGDGGGDPFSGVLQLPTNQEVITVVGDGDEDVAVDETGTFSFAVNSSAFFVVVAVYTDEYPTYTGDGSEFNDTVEYTDNPIVGNDDAYGSPNPATDPYSNGGNLQSLDTPTRTLTFVGGNAGATYLNVSSFQEFARLEINGKWYLISDVDPWTVNFRFSKIEVNEAFWNFDANQDGDTADAISEQQVNQDLNRNGSSSDNLSIWINNNSDTQN